MKALSFITVICLFAGTSIAQTTLIVDHNFNAPTGAHIFSTIQEAVDAASHGDIIQIQPSPNSYGSATVNKQLTIMGIGFGLTKDIPLITTITNLTLTNNLTDGTNASGSVITGLNMTNLYFGTNQGLSNDTLRDVTIHNNQIDYIRTSYGYLPLKDFSIYGNDIINYLAFYEHISGNSVIRNNLIRSQYIQLVISTPCDLIIANNIIYGYITINATQSSVSILNNNFISATGNYAFGTLYDKTVANNIFYGRTPSNSVGGASSSSFQRNIFTNNISISTGNDALPPAGTNTGSGNLEGQTVGFINVPFSNTWSSAHDFTLDTGSSQALGAGSDGTDMGITGGPYSDFWTVGNTEINLVLRTTSAPTIEILNTTGVINPGDNLPVRVKAKSN